MQILKDTIVRVCKCVFEYVSVCTVGRRFVGVFVCDEQIKNLFFLCVCVEISR